MPLKECRAVFGALLEEVSGNTAKVAAGVKALRAGGEWFDQALQRLGDLRDVEAVLAKEFYRLACYADLVPLAPGSTTLRIYQSSRMLREDGGIVRVLIYFVLRENDSVELQHVEAIEEEKV